MKFRAKKKQTESLYPTNNNKSSTSMAAAAEMGNINETVPAHHHQSLSPSSSVDDAPSPIGNSSSCASPIFSVAGFSIAGHSPCSGSSAVASAMATPDWPTPSSPSSPPPPPVLLHSASAPSLSSLQGLLKYIAERGSRRYGDRQRWRLVMKDGSCNVSSMHVTERRRKYLSDLFTTVVDMKWRFNLLMFALGFVVSWTVFALLWWIIAYVNGDCNTNNDDDPESNQPPPLSTNTTTTSAIARNNGGGPCVSNVNDFWTALLFSIESQHTIGYGHRVIETNCTSAILVLMLQSCIGVFIQCLITGIVFSKLSRPKSRAQTIMFSRTAVVCRREGHHCLLFRVGDMRKSHIIGTSIRAMVVLDRVTSEGECIPLCQSPLKVETEMGGPGDTFAFLVWPVTVTHVIDEESPLWDVAADQLISERFEIIVMLEGTVESNGKLTQVRTSYLPSEILWGHRLMPLFTYQTTKGTYEIDYKQFNSTIAISMTEHSAKTESELAKAADGDMGDQPHQKPFYQNTENHSSISLVRCQGIGQPMEMSLPRRLYKRFRPAGYGTDAQEKL